MTFTEQKVIFADQIAEIEKVLTRKGSDYTKGEDSLEVFKKIGHLADLSPLDVCKMFVCAKVVRINNLLQTGDKPNYDSIRDSFLDLQCYSILWEQIYIDSKNENRD